LIYRQPTNFGTMQSDRTGTKVIFDSATVIAYFDGYAIQTIG